MRDGVRLSADVYLPDDETAAPAILVRTPYDNTRPDFVSVARRFTAHGYPFAIQDTRGRGLKSLEEATQEIVAAGNGTTGLSSVFSLFNTSTPKIYADIDRLRAQMLGVSADRVFETLEVYLGSTFVNEFNFLGRTYRVTAQADGERISCAPMRQSTWPTARESQ